MDWDRLRGLGESAWRFVTDAIAAAGWSDGRTALALARQAQRPDQAGPPRDTYVPPPETRAPAALSVAVQPGARLGMVGAEGEDTYVSPGERPAAPQATPGIRLGLVGAIGEGAGVQGPSSSHSQGPTSPAGGGGSGDDGTPGPIGLEAVEAAIGNVGNMRKLDGFSPEGDSTRGWIAQFVHQRFRTENVREAERHALFVGAAYLANLQTLERQGFRVNSPDAHGLVRGSLGLMDWSAIGPAMKDLTDDAREKLDEILARRRAQMTDDLERYVLETGGLDGESIAPDQVSRWVAEYVTGHFQAAGDHRARDLADGVITAYRTTLDMLEAFGLHRAERATHILIRDALERVDLQTGVSSEKPGGFELSLHAVDDVIGSERFKLYNEVTSRIGLKGFAASRAVAFIVFGLGLTDRGAALAEADRISGAVQGAMQYLGSIGVDHDQIASALAYGALMELIDLDAPVNINADALVARIRGAVLKEADKLASADAQGTLPRKVDFGEGLVDGRTALPILSRAAKKIRGDDKGGPGGSGGSTSGGATPAPGGSTTPAPNAGGGSASAKGPMATSAFSGLVVVGEGRTVTTTPAADLNATETPADTSAALYLSPGADAFALPPMAVGTPAAPAFVP